MSAINLLCSWKNLYAAFLILYGGPQVSRQNFLSQGKTFFLRAKLSFSRQNFLSQGKTFFLKTKLSSPRQNLLSQDKNFFPKTKLFSQDKTFFRKAKLSFSMKNFLSKDKTLLGGNQKETNSMLSKSCYHGCC